MAYVTISEISRCWQVDRTTARTSLQRAVVPLCDLSASPRCRWDEALRKTPRPHATPPGGTRA